MSEKINKKLKSKGLWARLAALMVVLLMTTAQNTLMAQTTVTTLDELTSALKNNFNIRLGKDIKLTKKTKTLVVSKTGTLDLNGYTITGYDKNNAVIEVKYVAFSGTGNLTLKDSSSSGNGKIKDGSIGVSVSGINNPTFIMNGGTITGNKNYGVQVNSSGASFTMNAGTITGNTNYGVNVGYGDFTMNGGIIAGGSTCVSVSATSEFKMYGGTITGGSTGVSVSDPSLLSFTMDGGTITGCSTGVSVNGTIAYFTMNGGTITGNTTYGVNFQKGTVTLGGTAKITGNTKGNLYLAKNKTVKIGSSGLSSEASIGVTLANTTGNVTTDKTNNYAKYFTSDKSGYIAVNDNGYVAIKSGTSANIKAEIDDKGGLYTSVKTAISKASSSVKMINNSTETDVAITDKTVILDLNGHELSSTGSVITVGDNGNLTLKDSSSSGNGKIKGGSIGVYVEGSEGLLSDKNATFTMNGGKIENCGYGVQVKNYGNFNMNSGTITGNTTDGVYVKGTSALFTMANGTIIGNSTCGVNLLKGTFNMNGGTITGGSTGVSVTASGDNLPTFNMNGGEIKENNCGVDFQKGTVNFGTKDLVCTAKIKDNNGSNLYLASGKTVTINNLAIGTASFGVKLAAGAGIVGNSSADYSSCFTSDDGDYYVAYDDGKIKVVKYIAKIGNAGYTSVQAALYAASSNETVKMVATSTENVTVNKKVILNLNGYELKGNSASDPVISISSSGDLTLVDNNTSNGIGKITGGSDGVKLSTNTAKFTMNSGTITGNSNYGVNFQNGTVTLGGTAKITGNTSGNLYLASGKTVSVDGLSSGANIGVTTQDKPETSSVYVTTQCTTDYSGYFTSDEDYDMGYVDRRVVLNNIYYVKIVETGVGYNTLGEAIGAANGQTVKMLKNLKENISISNTVTIDLNGCMLEGTGNGSVITVNSGYLTLKDSGNGGKVTGGSAANGGGVNVAGGTFEMIGGTITGNSATTSGGGVYAGGTVILGGTAKISNNTGGNLYLPKDKTVSYSSNKPLETGAQIGVTTQTEPVYLIPVKIAPNYTDNMSSYFTSDNSQFLVVYYDDLLYRCVVLTKTGQAANVQIEGTSTTYASLTEALNADVAGKTLKLLADLTENVTIAKNVTINLNGHKISGSDNSKPIINITKGQLILKGEGEITGGSTGVQVSGSDASFTMNGGEITVDVMVNGGTLNFVSGTITGNITVNAGTITGTIPAGHTLAINNGSTINGIVPVVSGSVMSGEITVNGGELNINGGNVEAVTKITVNSNGTIAGEVIIPEGMTLDMKGGAIAGNVTVNTGSYLSGNVVVASSGALTINGAGMVGVTGISFNGVVNFNGGTVSCGIDVSVGDFLMSGGTITGLVTVSGGSFVMTGGKIENVVSDHGGLYVVGGGNVTLGGTAKIISNKNSNGDPCNLYLAPGKTVAIATGDNKLANGAEILVTLESTSGDFAVGASDGDDAYFGSDNAYYYDCYENGKMVLKDASGFTMIENTGLDYTVPNDNCSIDGVIEVDKDITFTFETGTIHNNTDENIIVHDGGYLKTHKVVRATVEKKTTNNTRNSGKYTIYQWYLICSPVQNQLIDDVIGLPSDENEYDLYRLSDDGKWWENYENSAHSGEFYYGNNCEFEFGRIYLYASKNGNDDGNELKFKGAVNTNDVTYPLKAGLNLVGNPYTEKIDLPAIDGLKGFYRLQGTGTWTTNLVGSGNKSLSPMEGVLIDVPEAGTITMSRGSYGTDGSSGATNYMEVSVANAQYDDRAYAVFGGEGGGLTKIEHLSDEAPMLYIQQDGDDYAIASMGESAKEFPVSFEAKTTGKYVLSMNSNRSYTYLHLIDHETNAEIDMLANKEYEFIGSPADSRDRFTVRFELGGEEANEQHFAYQVGSELVVSGEGTLQVFDVLGRIVLSEEVNGSTRVSVSGLRTGAYIVRMIGNEIKTQKVVIK